MPYWCHTKIDECRLFHPTSHRVFTLRQISRPIFLMLLGHLFNWSLSEFWPPFHLIHPVPYYQSLLGTRPYVLAVSSMSTLYKIMLLSALSSFLWAPGLQSLLSLPGAYMGPSLSLCTKLTTEWKPEMSSILPMATYTWPHPKCLHAPYL